MNRGPGGAVLPAQILRERKPVVPFVERTVVDNLTYGLGPAGYDVRIAESFFMWPGRYVLGSTLERFVMDADLLGLVCDKSTWARRGITVQNTVIEPGWCGYLTLELANHSLWPIRIKAGQPIAQILFLQLAAPTVLPYDGKYQNQQPGPQQAR